jgi:hypothetical protein
MTGRKIQAVGLPRRQKFASDTIELIRALRQRTPGLRLFYCKSCPSALLGMQFALTSPLSRIRRFLKGPLIVYQ